MTDFWQDISTVPMGQWVLVTVANMARGYFTVAACIDGTWVRKGDGKVESMAGFGQPTHWSSIEDPPEHKRIVY